MASSRHQPSAAPLRATRWAPQSTSANLANSEGCSWIAADEQPVQSRLDRADPPRVLVGQPGVGEQQVEQEQQPDRGERATAGPATGRCWPAGAGRPRTRRCRSPRRSPAWSPTPRRCRPRRSPSRWSPRRPWSARSATAGRRWTAAGSSEASGRSSRPRSAASPPAGVDTAQRRRRLGRFRRRARDPPGSGPRAVVPVPVPRSSAAPARRRRPAAARPFPPALPLPLSADSAPPRGRTPRHVDRPAGGARTPPRNAGTVGRGAGPARIRSCWRGTRCRTGPGRWPRRCRR